MKSPDLTTVLNQAVARLAGLVGPSGRFTYQFSWSTGDVTAGYNILRHCGSVWAIATALPAAGASTTAACDRAIAWLAAKHLAPSRSAGLCVVERGSAKLGANGLAILALSALPATPLRDRMMAGLCEHVVSQIGDHGDFEHKVDYGTGAVMPFRSGYYTGEALFGLCVAERRCPGSLTEQVFALVEGLVDRRYGVAEQSHWMMYAVEHLHRLRPLEALARYADEAAESILADTKYRDRQMCTPIACRSEALVAYLKLVGRLRRGGDLTAAAKCALRENIGMQLRDYRADGAFVCGAGSDKVRIDYLQHNISAISGFLDLGLTMDGTGDQSTTSERWP